MARRPKAALIAFPFQPAPKPANTYPTTITDPPYNYTQETSVNPCLDGADVRHGSSTNSIGRQRRAPKKCNPETMSNRGSVTDRP